MSAQSSDLKVGIGAHGRYRFWYTTFTLATTVVLIGWGGFVTSIDAGLAVPDWPSSFNSYDPFNPWPEWWTLTPVLAEHGHRLLGALVGLLTIGLAAWTWAADDRRWMRRLGVAALALVIVQGTLGGLRVVWISLDLAVVHACVAQLYFSLLACMALFTTETWRRASREGAAYPASHRSSTVRLALATSAAIYLQIIFGALLRHPGTGIDPALAGMHMAGAAVVLTLGVVLFLHARRRPSLPAVRRLATILFIIILSQIALGITAYLVLLDERGMLLPSNLQVIVNTTHLLVGALLFATSVLISMLSLRMSRSESASYVRPGARTALDPA